MDFQFQRVDVPVPVSRQTYELTLTRPIGIEIEGMFAVLSDLPPYLFVYSHPTNISFALNPLHRNIRWLRRSDWIH
jgi:hypothetical protein